MLTVESSTVKKLLALASSHISFGLVTIFLYNNVVAPSPKFLPHLPVFLYNFLATAITLLFLAGLVLGIWQLLKEGCKHIVVKELRAYSIEKIRSWPNSKWDIVWTLAIAYLLFIAVLTLTVTQVIPIGRVAGVISPEEAANIAVFMLMPLMLFIVPLLLRAMMEMFKDTKQRWRSGARRERITLAASMTFVLVGYGVVLLGDYAGWDHLLWFNGG